METEPTAIPDVLLVRSTVFEDERGFLMEIFHEEKFAAVGLPTRFVQDNYSRSSRGVLRGLHFQNPAAQGKLVRVTVGAVFDVAVDIRRGSPFFGQWVGREISAQNRLALYIPPGFAHGFCALSDIAEFMYKCTELYAPEHEHGILWSDPAIGIEWPVSEPALSQKDRAYPTLAECEGVLPVYRG